MAAYELQHAPQGSRWVFWGLPDPCAIAEMGLRGSLIPTPLARFLTELPCFCSAGRTPKFWQRVPVGDRNSSGLVLLRVGFSRKTKKGKARSSQQTNGLVARRLR